MHKNLFCKVEVAKQEIRRKVRGYRLKARKQKSHPNGWLFWYCKDLKDFKVVKDYSSLVQLVCNMRRYER